MGAEQVVILGAQNLPDEVRAWTEGYGVDAVVLATATQSNSPTEQAIEALRDRGRIVVVGNTKVDLPWKNAYEKEIEVRYSRSYGPGRYDPAYEWGGTDYPIGYVRWTEQRNFDACLHLMKTGELDLAALTTRRVPFGECLAVYRDLLGEAATKEVGVVLEYSTPATDGLTRNASEKRRRTSSRQAPAQSAAPLAARSAPRRHRRRQLRPHDAAAAPEGPDRLWHGRQQHLAQRQPCEDQVRFCRGGDRCERRFRGETLFESPAAGQPEPRHRIPADAAVLIATRHHLHAPLVVQALAANRHVFVEKPLCLTREELADIDAAMAKSSGSVQVGFNRRFAAPAGS